MSRIRRDDKSKKIAKIEYCMSLINDKEFLKHYFYIGATNSFSNNLQIFKKKWQLNISN